MKRVLNHQNLPAAILRMTWMIMAFAFGALSPAPARAGDDDQPTTVRLEVDPMPAPRAALEYQLLPPFMDRKPGNAAVLYNEAGIRFAGQDGSDDKRWDEIIAWLKMPPAELPQDDVARELGRFGIVLKQVHIAARREDCDWVLPIRETGILGVNLDGSQRTRSYGQLLALKARLEIAQGRFEQAIETLQSGLALARHVAAGPTMINGVIGSLISRMTLEQVEAWIQQPGAANLYWALTHLPRPLVDGRTGFEAEMNQLALSFPELNNLEQADYPPEYWQQLLGRLSDWLDTVDDEPLRGRFLLTARAVRGYPMAKQYLIDRGRSPEEVEAMSVPQVVLLYTVRVYDELRDDVFKWFNVPYWQAQQGFAEADDRLDRESERREILPVASALLPAVHYAHEIAARDQRRIALLRTIEAIRIHGAAHDGRLPLELDKITEVPLPIDPVTGKRFVYRLDGDTAVFESPRLRYSPGSALRYEIKFRR